ncbi:MAG: hypothetical protein DDT22_00777 [candidate division WS2 bacterium]|nr:hypothetical protein [Candidatus Lithacetigena glycinireducens]
MQRILEGYVISSRKADAGKQSGDFELLMLRDTNDRWSRSTVERIVGDGAIVDFNKKIMVRVDDQEYFKNGVRKSFVKLVSFVPSFPKP